VPGIPSSMGIDLDRGWMTMKDLQKICHLADAIACAFRKVSLKAGTGLSPLTRVCFQAGPPRHHTEARPFSRRD
jgi:hypothetical protein